MMTITDARKIRRGLTKWPGDHVQYVLEVKGNNGSPWIVRTFDDQYLGYDSERRLPTAAHIWNGMQQLREGHDIASEELRIVYWDTTIHPHQWMPR
jgi:hypothetical protein